MEQEIQKQLQQITESVKGIEKKIIRMSGLRAFFNGIMSGIGSIVGIALALALIGWILNAMDIIPAFKDSVESWRQDFQQAQIQKIPAALTSPVVVPSTEPAQPE